MEKVVHLVFTPSIVDLFVKIEWQIQIELIYLAVTLMPANKFHRSVSHRRRQLIRS